MHLIDVALRSMMGELAKIAQASHPGIVAPPTPGGDGTTSKGLPAQPTTSRSLVGKVVSRTNLQKTNYTAPSTGSVSPDNSVTAGAHMMAPPPVTVA